MFRHKWRNGLGQFCKAGEQTENPSSDGEFCPRCDMEHSGPCLAPNLHNPRVRSRCFHFAGGACLVCPCGDLCANDECKCKCHKKEEQKQGPYPWCRDPERCNKVGYCPNNPSCGD